jgi:proline iminopeptidase
MQSKERKMTKATPSGSIRVEGAELSYVIEGEGIPCLVLGGATYYPRTFSQRLRKYFRFVFMDSRHFVPSDPEFDVSRITLDTYADDVETARKTLGLSQVAVLGHSIHGDLALEYARRHPETTSHAIVLAAPPCGMGELDSLGEEFWASDASEERKAIFERTTAERGAEIAQLPPEQAMVATYIASAPKYWFDPTYDCSHLWEGVKPNMAVINHLFGVLFGTYDIAQGPGEITTPVFLALGRYDYVVPYTSWDNEKEKLPNLSHSLFEKSGHTPQLEEAELFDQRLIDWVRRG